MTGQPNFKPTAWRKGPGSDTGGCVEVAFGDGHIGVRDSKARGDGPVLVFTEHEWSVFVDGVTQGLFSVDHLRATS